MGEVFPSTSQTSRGRCQTQSGCSDAVRAQCRHLHRAGESTRIQTFSFRWGTRPDSGLRASAALGKTSSLEGSEGCECVYDVLDTTARLPIPSVWNYFLSDLWKLFPFLMQIDENKKTNPKREFIQIGMSQHSHQLSI